MPQNDIIIAFGVFYSLLGHLSVLYLYLYVGPFYYAKSSRKVIEIMYQTIFNLYSQKISTQKYLQSI